MTKPMFNRWDEFIPVAIEILGRHSTVHEAMREMSEELGRPVSRGSLKEALRCRGFASASKHLKQNQWSAKGQPEFTEKAHRPELSVTPEPEPQPPVTIQPPETVGPENPRRVDVQKFEIMYRKPLSLAGEKRWLIVSDFHGPWTDYEAYHMCLNSEFAQNATGVIFDGDLLDCEQMNRKHERTTDMPLSVHYKEMCERVIKPAMHLPKLEEARIVAGNHDNWTKKYKGHRIIPDAYFMLQDQAGHDLMEVLGHIKLEVPDERLVYRFGAKNWWTRLGDAVVAHPIVFLGPTQAGKPGRTVWERFDWFWKRNPTIRCLVIGHTHKVYEEKCCPAKYGSVPIMLMESGSFQHEDGTDYTVSGKSKHEPYHVGWAELVQVDGVTDMERSRAVLHKVVG